MDSADRARRERNITIAIGVVLVLLIAAFVVRNRFQSEEPPPLVPDGPVVSQTGDAQALEDFLGSGSSADNNGASAAAAPRTPPPPRRREKIAPPTKRVEAEIAVSVGGREVEATPRQPAPARRETSPAPPAQVSSRTPHREEEVEPVAPPPRRTVTYVVQKGDNLSKIAVRYYGRGSDYVLIQRANNLPSANMLRVGQRLVIPSKEETPATARRAAASSAARPRATGAADRTYVVKNGDTLWKIATKVYGKGHKWGTILQANSNILRTEDDLKVGQTLRIPEAR